MLNCPNCGYPFDPKKDRCEYCGTSCYDICALTLDPYPFNLLFKTERYSYVSKACVSTVSIRQPSLQVNIDDRRPLFGRPPTRTLSVKFALLSDPLIIKKEQYGS